jgi:methionine-gamma-lyase
MIKPSKSSSWKVQTQAVHAGEAPDSSTGASAPNLVMSSTYVVPANLPFSAESLEAEMPYIYTRWSNPTVAQLEAKLAVLEGAEAGLCFASGMAAATGLFTQLLRQGDHLLISDVTYAGVREYANEVLPGFGIEVTPVDMSNVTEVKAALRENTKLVWIETPCNPIMRLTDIAAVAALSHSVGASLGVDSTFASPIATQPLSLGADYVMHSLTKYVGGHGDAMGGVIVANKDKIAALRQKVGIHAGAVLSPFNAWLILRGLATLPLRMKAHEAGALQVAAFLENHPKVLKVMYPGLSSHPQHELAKKQMSNFSGMLTFQVKDGSKMAEQLSDRLAIFHYAVSLGHHRSLIYYMDTQDLMGSSFKLTGEPLARYRAFAGDGVFRVSVGIEDPEDLCQDLAQALV